MNYELIFSLLLTKGFYYFNGTMNDRGETCFYFSSNHNNKGKTFEMMVNNNTKKINICYNEEFITELAEPELMTFINKL